MMTGGCAHSGSIGVGLMLAVMAVGYWVLRTALKENGVPKMVGQAVGWIILALSLAGTLCGVVSHICRGACGVKARHCPVERAGSQGVPVVPQSP